MKKESQEQYLKKERTRQNKFKPTLYFAALSGFFSTLFARKAINKGGGKRRRGRFSQAPKILWLSSFTNTKGRTDGIEVSKRFKRRRVKGHPLTINEEKQAARKAARVTK